VNGGALAVGGDRQVFLQQARAVDDAAEAVDQHGQDRTHAGEQENRRDRQLDQVGDIGRSIENHCCALLREALKKTTAALVCSAIPWVHCVMRRY